jgi:tRNA-2-methylthio-N6-dimethylallyladenosine synthase
MTGRARDGRLVHMPVVEGVRPGDVVETVVTRGAPHYLEAGEPISHRTTTAGNNWAAGQLPKTTGVPLGMPGVGLPG